MKVLVCISSVPDTTSKINFTGDSKALDKNGVQFVINPYDEFCLTRAIWLQEKSGATVTIVTVGDASVEPVMRKALAIGANDAIRINIIPKDSISVAKEIKKIADEGGYDIIFTGRESIDYNSGAVGGYLAGLLGYSFINCCVGLEVDGQEVKATREIDGGRETLSASLPAVVAGQKGLVEETDLRIPNMRGIMQARSKPLKIVEPQDESSVLNVVGFDKPATRGEVKLIEPDNIKELVRALSEDAKVI